MHLRFCSSFSILTPPPPFCPFEEWKILFLFAGLYDGGEHTPKLLPCSHTVCLHCLSRIAASQTRDTGSFRCPICRELITIPRGGVSALPPSFLVNQLLDLMSRQRREVIPKCSVHINQVGAPTMHIARFRYGTEWLKMVQYWSLTCKTKWYWASNEAVKMLGKTDCWCNFVYY